MATATLGAAPAAGASSASRTTTVSLQVGWAIRSGEAQPQIEVSSDDTLGTIIDKVLAATKTEYHVGIVWDGRDPVAHHMPKPRTSHGSNQYRITWGSGPDPEIEATTGTPDNVLERLGIAEKDKTVKVSADFFAKVKIKDVCDLKHCSHFDVMIYAALGKRGAGSAPASASPISASASAQSSIASARDDEKR